MSASHVGRQDEDDWSHVSDRQERKRIQNRLAQRNYRRNLKQRIEVLEGLAAECTGSPGNPVRNEPRELSFSGECHDGNVPGSMPGSAAVNTSSQLEAMLEDPQIAQHDPAAGMDRNHAFTMIDPRLRSYNEHEQDMSWLSAAHNPPGRLNPSPEATVQYNLGFQPASSDQLHSQQQQPVVSQVNHNENSIENRSSRASREGLRIRTLPGSRRTSKRFRTGDEYGSDVDLEVPDAEFSRLFGPESDSSSGPSWNAYSSNSDRISRSSSTSLSIAAGCPQPPSRNTDTSRVSTSTPGTAATGTLSSRIASAQASLKSHGFTSVEDLVTQFWTADLSDRPALADAQRLSRRRELPRLLSTLRERASQWDDWESQGWGDEATRSAETVLVEECQQFLSKTGPIWRSRPYADTGDQQQSIPPEEVVRLKRIFQEKIPNLYVLLDSLGQCSRKTEDDDDVNDNRSRVVVSAICSLLADGEHDFS